MRQLVHAAEVECEHAFVSSEALGCIHEYSRKETHVLYIYKKYPSILNFIYITKP